VDDLRGDARSRARDAGLARLRRTTRVTVFGATALAGVFAGVAASSNPGHKAPAAASSRVTTTRRLAPTPRPRAQTETTVPAPANAPAPPPPPPPPPVTATAPPVVVSGAT
jgi:hypothetical protein